MIPIATHIYRGCIIGRNTRLNGLKWICYCEGRQLATDTLEGMKYLIKKTLAQ